MQFKKSVLRLIVFAACAVLASGCAMQATTAGEDDATKTGSGQAVASSNGGASSGSTGAQ